MRESRRRGGPAERRAGPADPALGQELRNARPGVNEATKRGAATPSVALGPRVGSLGGGFVFVGDGDGDERGRRTLLDRVARDDALLHVAPGGQFELDLEQDLLDDRAQATGPGLALERLVGDRG